MATRTHNVEASLLDDRIDALDRNAVEASPAKEVFRAVSAILALVRDKMIDNEDYLQLSEYCFNVCEVLKTVMQGKDVDDLNESVRETLQGLERVRCEIEQTLKRRTSTPHIKHNRSKVEGRKRQIQATSDALEARNSPAPSVSKRVASSTPVGPRRTATVSMSGSACGRLITRAFAFHKRPLIETMFSGRDGGDAIRCLLGDDPQTFIDVIDEVLDRPDLWPWTRERCLKSLYRTCGRHALLPRTLKIPVRYSGVALFRGGFADVWKGEHDGRDVAVKVIRTYSDSDLEKIIGRFCKEVVTWKTLRHPNILPLIGVTISETRFAMISDWMVNGNIGDFVKAHPDANRLELLQGVAKGLIYIHNQGMIHGDLKGANILIDQTGCACLADFGLLTIISDPANLLSSSSHTQGGTFRWMAPELIDPQRFGFQKSRPTKSSDCYALGMVIYETVCGNLPFHEHTDPTVVMKVLKGERPPRGVGFTRSLWNMLELCWASQASSRPSIEGVLRGLEMVPNLLEPPSPGVDEGVGMGGDDWDSLSSPGVDEETESDWNEVDSTTPLVQSPVAIPVPLKRSMDEDSDGNSSNLFQGDPDPPAPPTGSNQKRPLSPTSEDNGGEMKRPKVDGPKLSPTSKQTPTPSTRPSPIPFGTQPTPSSPEVRQLDAGRYRRISPYLAPILPPHPRPIGSGMALPPIATISPTSSESPGRDEDGMAFDRPHSMTPPPSRAKISEVMNRPNKSPTPTPMDREHAH